MISVPLDSEMKSKDLKKVLRKTHKTSRWTALEILLTQQRGDAGQDGQQGGGAEPGGGQCGLLGETHGLPLPVPLAHLGLLVLLLLTGPGSSSQAGTDGHGDRPGAGET